MLIKNGKVFIDGEYRDVDVRIAKGRIVQIGKDLKDEEVYDATNQLVFAGFIDSHIHGGCFGNCGDSVENMKDICATLPKYGITSFTPTPTSSNVETVSAKLKNIRAAKGAPGADIMGIFLYAYKGRLLPAGQEYVGPTKENTMALADGDISDISHILVAPELPGALEWIDWAVSVGIIPLIGFTEAKPEIIKEAVRRGARLTDHFPNGFPQVDHHESQGVMQCILEDGLYHQMTCDCIHVAPEFMRMIIRVKGVDHIFAVDDSNAMMGQPEGEYMYNGRKVIIKDGAIRNETGKLVSGAHTFDENMRTMLKNGFTKEEIGMIFSENCAKALRINDRGKIEEGRRADITVMDENFYVQRTMIKGEWFYVK